MAAAALAGCGGSKSSTTTSTTTAVPDPAAAMRALIGSSASLGGSVHTLYQGTNWAVVAATSANKATAYAFRLSDGQWVPDRSGRVKLKILGPQPGATTTRTPQGRDRVQLEHAVRRVGDLGRRYRAAREGRRLAHERDDLRRARKAAEAGDAHRVRLCAHDRDWQRGGLDVQGRLSRAKCARRRKPAAKARRIASHDGRHHGE